MPQLRFRIWPEITKRREVSLGLSAVGLSEATKTHLQSEKTRPCSSINGNKEGRWSHQSPKAYEEAWPKAKVSRNNLSVSVRGWGSSVFQKIANEINGSKAGFSTPLRCIPSSPSSLTAWNTSRNLWGAAASSSLPPRSNHPLNPCGRAPTSACVWPPARSKITAIS